MANMANVVKLGGVPFQYREAATDALEKIENLNEKRSAAFNMLATVYRVIKIALASLAVAALLVGAPLLDVLVLGLGAFGVSKLHHHMQETFKARAEADESLFAQLRNRVQQLPLEAQAVDVLPLAAVAPPALEQQG